MLLLGGLLVLTILVALKDKKNNRIILGTDKQVTTGSVKELIHNKIVTVNIPVVDGYGEKIRTDKCHIAIAGYVYINNFIEYAFNAPPMDNNMIFIEYLQKKFLKKLREELTNQNLAEVNSNQFDSESGFLIVYDDEIFVIDFNFGVCTINDEYSVNGSGFEIALGSLYTTKKVKPSIGAVKRVKLAVKSAIEYDVYCGGEVDIKIINY